MPTQDIPLGENWHGLNRSVIPQSLPASESPDTTDARNVDKTLGALGARLGRTVVSSRPNELLGLGLANFPWGRFRTTHETDGTWHAGLVPWPSPVAPAAVTSGFALIQIRNLVVSGTSGTTSYSSEAAIGSFEIGDFGQRLIFSHPSYPGQITFDAPTLTTPSSAELTSNEATITFSAPHGIVAGDVIKVDLSDNSYDGTYVVTSVTSNTVLYSLVHANISSAGVSGTVQNLSTPSDYDGVLTVQCYIDGAWNDAIAAYNGNSGSGIFTKVRLKLVVNAGSAAFVNYQPEWDLYMIYGSNQYTITV
jgi:hypothetical protein